MAVTPMPSPGADGPPPTPLSASLDRVLAGFGAPPAPVLTTLTERWADVVGPAAADNSRPAGVQRGCLRIEVEAPAWASQLRWESAAILSRIEALVGAGAVDAIEVRVRSG